MDSVRTVLKWVSEQLCVQSVKDFGRFPSLPAPSPGAGYCVVMQTSRQLVNGAAMSSLSTCFNALALLKVYVYVAQFVALHLDMQPPSSPPLQSSHPSRHAAYS